MEEKVLAWYSQGGSKYKVHRLLSIIDRTMHIECKFHRWIDDLDGRKSTCQMQSKGIVNTNSIGESKYKFHRLLSFIDRAIHIDCKFHR